MSGRNPPLYCTLTLIAMQGHQAKQRQETRCAWMQLIFVTLCLLMGSDGCAVLCITILSAMKLSLQIDKAGDKVSLSDNYLVNPTAGG